MDAKLRHSLFQERHQPTIFTLYNYVKKKPKYVYSKHYIEKEGETTKSVHIIQEYIIEKAKTNPKQIRVHIYRYIKMRQN